jgi:hypothetical protein
MSGQDWRYDKKNPSLTVQNLNSSVAFTFLRQILNETMKQSLEKLGLQPIGYPGKKHGLFFAISATFLPPLTLTNTKEQYCK